MVRQTLTSPPPTSPQPVSPTIRSSSNSRYPAPPRHHPPPPPLPLPPMPHPYRTLPLTGPRPTTDSLPSPSPPMPPPSCYSRRTQRTSRSSQMASSTCPRLSTGESSTVRLGPEAGGWCRVAKASSRPSWSRASMPWWRMDGKLSSCPPFCALSLFFLSFFSYPSSLPPLLSLTSRPN